MLARLQVHSMNVKHIQVEKERLENLSKPVANVSKVTSRSQKASTFKHTIKRSRINVNKTDQNGSTHIFFNPFTLLNI